MGLMSLFLYTDVIAYTAAQAGTQRVTQAMPMVDQQVKLAAFEL